MHNILLLLHACIWDFLAHSCCLVPGVFKRWKTYMLPFYYAAQHQEDTLPAAAFATWAWAGRVCHSSVICLHGYSSTPASFGIRSVPFRTGPPCRARQEKKTFGKKAFCFCEHLACDLSLCVFPLSLEEAGKRKRKKRGNLKHGLRTSS